MGNVSSLHLRTRRRRLDDASPVEHLYTKPSGLYPTCAWDVKLVRRLILRGELAPRHPGRDDACEDAREECPICMLVYPVLNETRCCAARLCTECYLQIRPPRHNKEPCPFCKYKRLDASYKGPRDVRDMDREDMEQKKALDAIKRAHLAAASAESSSLSSPDTAPVPPNTLPDPDIDSSSQSSQPCPCPHPHAPDCRNHHRPKFYCPDHPAAIDPLLLEAMASEANFANAQMDRGSASSLPVSDVHANDDSSSHVPTEGQSQSLDYPISTVFRLPWYGHELYQHSSASSSDAPVTDTKPLAGEEHLSLHEAIRRSLIDM